MRIKKNVVMVSVRDLVEFVLRSGDLVSGFFGTSRTTDAIKAHQKVQKMDTENYVPEVSVRHSIEKEYLILEINGRIDGIITESSGIIIDEIKTTTQDLEDIFEEGNILHWAQAKCYAYIYALQNNLDKVGVQLTYYQLDKGDIKRFRRDNEFKELEEFFYQLVDGYMHWAKFTWEWMEKRNLSIDNLNFPFAKYRLGQRDMAVNVYGTIRDKSKIYIQAPTGIGKTMGALFPAIKAFTKGLTSKVFYATAKTITGVEVRKALENLSMNNLRMKAVWITAKDKICFKSKAVCDPEQCEYAKGHFDRINNALEDILSEDLLTREKIEQFAEKHKVCPFELSLDLTVWSDIVICDYNYIFDPRVSLKRFFLESGGEYTVLIDEAHNLVDRSREMFSSIVYKKEVLEAKNLCKNSDKELGKSLNKINSQLVKMRKTCIEEGKSSFVSKELPTELITLIRKFMKQCEKWLLENQSSEIREKILELYFNFNSYIKTSEVFDDKYILYCEITSEDFLVKLFCMDPSKLLQETLKGVSSAVCFSATLSPMEYFISLLGGGEDSYRLKIGSPFKKQNLCLMINDRISTKYKYRHLTYGKISEYINCIIEGKKGNYIAFFPSYEYMHEVYRLFTHINTNIATIIQKSDMNDEERENFLQHFKTNPSETLVGFAVMGGIFSEGVDLKGDKLSGAIIVGVGLPKICLERELIKEHFEALKGSGEGFRYAYIYPGMNKVMQAAGRVIRTEEDKGIVLLLDERFTSREYLRLFPIEWEHYLKVTNKIEKLKIINEFWENKVEK
ncbi:MAG: helicase C-terminal domain-containing protein [Bacillota bacterium]|nr:helicase C-terminal domain-containing protein [Bacillota bacterium]